MNTKLNWPISLSEIELYNMSITELWMLKESMEAGAGERSSSEAGFGFKNCYYTIGDQRFQIKYRHVIHTHNNVPAKESTLLIVWVKKL